MKQNLIHSLMSVIFSLSMMTCAKADSVTEPKNPLLGKWQIGKNLKADPQPKSACKRPYFIFSEDKLINQTDADGTLVTFKNAIKSYKSIPYQVIVEFKKNESLSAWESEKNTVHFIILSNDQIMMQQFGKDTTYGTLPLYRCPSKPN